MKSVFGSGKTVGRKVLDQLKKLHYPLGLLLDLGQNLKIRNRLILFFLLISLIPISIVGFISYNSSKEAIRQKIAQYSIDGLSQVVSNIQTKMTEIENASKQLFNNDQFKSNLKNLVLDPDDSNVFLLKKTVSSYFNEYMLSNQDIFALMFIPNLSTDRSVIVARHYEKGFYNFLAAFNKTMIYQNIAKAGGGMSWSTTFKVDKGNFVLLGRSIMDPVTRQSLGILAFVMDEEKLDRIVNLNIYNKLTIEVGELKDYSLIINYDGLIVSSPEKETIGINIKKIMRDAARLKPILESTVSDRDYGSEVNQGSFLNWVNNQEVLVTYKTIGLRAGIGGSGWHLLSIAPTYYLYAEARSVGITTLIIGLFFGLLAVFLSLRIAFGISGPLDQVVEAMKQAEKGFLTARTKVNTRDELGYLATSFNLMIERISGLIIDTRQVIDVVLKRSTVLEISSEQSLLTAKGVAASMEQISKGVIEQNMETEKSSLQMNDLAEEIDLVVSKAGEVMEITDSTRQLGLSSKEAVQLLIDKTNETDRITSIIYKDINDLNVSAEEIQHITDVITNIAEQTNLLALNAAIEAARAGEMGRGFAVVAEEVNKLASQSRQAAQTINGILKTIRDKTTVSTNSVAQANQIVGEQINAVQIAQRSFDEIITAMDQAVTKIADMNEMVNKINNAKEQTVQSIVNISTVSQESAAAAEEVSFSTVEQTEIAGQVKLLAGELRQKAEELVLVIEKFQTSTIDF